MALPHIRYSSTHAYRSPIPTYPTPLPSNPLSLPSSSHYPHKISTPPLNSSHLSFTLPGLKSLQEFTGLPANTGNSSVPVIDPREFPQIRAGGGPRTYPGGVTKWQWKRMLEKKARAREKVTLMKEKEEFEKRRRAQWRMIKGPERPWEAPIWDANDRRSGGAIPNDYDRRSFERGTSRPWEAEEEGLKERNFRAGAETVSRRSSRPWDGREEDGRERQRGIGTGMWRGERQYESSESSEGREFRGRGEAERGVWRGGEEGGVRGGGRRRAPIMPSAPLDLVRRFERRNQAEDLWNEDDGPEVFREEEKKKEDKWSADDSLLPPYLRSSNSPKKSSAHDKNSERTGQRSASKAPILRRAGETQSRANLEKVPGRRSSEQPSGVMVSTLPISNATALALNGANISSLLPSHANLLCSILSGSDFRADAMSPDEDYHLAYLAAAIDIALGADATSENSQLAHKQTVVRSLVLCPTHERATIVASSAKLILEHHKEASEKQFGVQTVLGGNRVPAEMTRLLRAPSQVLVATPEKLLDHIHKGRGMRQQLQGLRTVVVDNLDVHLSLGFLSSLKSVFTILPASRQTVTISHSNLSDKGSAEVDVVSRMLSVSN